MATASGVKAGKAFVVVEALDKTGAILRRVQMRVKQLGADIAGVGRKLMVFSALGLTPFAYGAKVFAGFDDSMRRVEARSAGTADEMSNLRDQAKELGRTTSFTAGQVGELQAKLAQKGFNRGQIRAMTEDVLALAKAAGSGGPEDATIAADLVSGTLRAYGMDVSEAAHVTDLFTATVNGSNFSLEALQTALATAAPNAARFNVSLEDTLSTLATMTNLNIDASTAATSFRNILLRMSNVSMRNTFNRQLEQLTGQTIAFTDAAGNLRKPQEILFEIGAAVKDLGTATQGDILGKLLGMRSITGGGALVQGANAFGDLRDMLDDVDGQAKRTAETMEGGLGGSFRKLLSAVEGVFISLGEGIAGELNAFIARVNPILNAVAQWIADNAKLVATIGMVIAGVGLAGAGLVALGVTIMSLSSIFGLLATAISAVVGLVTFLASPLGLIVAGVAAAGAAVFYLADASEFASETVGRMGEAFFGAWEGIKNAMAGGDLGLAAKIAWQAVKVVWFEATSSLLNVFTAFWAELQQTQNMLVTVLAKGMVNLWSGIKSTWTAAIGGLKSLFLGLMAWISDVMAAQMGPIIDKAADALDWVGADEKAARLREIADLAAETPRLIEQARRDAQDATAAHLEEIDQGRQDAIDALTDEEARKRAAIDQAANQRMQGRLAHLQEERDLLEELKQQAEDAARAAQAAQGFDENGWPIQTAFGIQGTLAKQLAEDAADNAPSATATAAPMRTIDAVEKGTIEAARKFAENQRGPLDVIAEHAERQTSLQEDIADNTANFGLGDAANA